MKLIKYFFISTIALLLLIFITGPNVYKIFQIKGYLPGAISQNITITDKWYDNGSNNPKSESAYWVCWDNVNIKKVSSKRLSLQKIIWDILKVDDIIGIITFKNDNMPYYKYGTFVSFKNIIFDIILFIAELICFFIFQVKGIKNYKTSAFTNAPKA